MDECGSELWVGHIKSKGNVLFDPELQEIRGSSLVYLFLVDTHNPRIEGYRRYDIKKQLTKLNPGQKEAMNSIYQAWKQINAADFIVNEIARIDVYRKSVARANKIFLEKFGLKFYGVRNNINQPTRTTSCWNCHQEIDNDDFLECIQCGWIICKCGACGCAYSHKNYSRSPKLHEPR